MNNIPKGKAPLYAELYFIKMHCKAVNPVILLKLINQITFLLMDK